MEIIRLNEADKNTVLRHTEEKKKEFRDKESAITTYNKLRYQGKSKFVDFAKIAKFIYGEDSSSGFMKEFGGTGGSNVGRLLSIYNFTDKEKVKFFDALNPEEVSKNNRFITLFSVSNNNPVWEYFSIGRSDDKRDEFIRLYNYYAKELFGTSWNEDFKTFVNNIMSWLNSDSAESTKFKKNKKAVEDEVETWPDEEKKEFADKLLKNANSNKH